MLNPFPGSFLCVGVEAAGFTCGYKHSTPFGVGPVIRGFLMLPRRLPASTTVSLDNVSSKNSTK